MADSCKNGIMLVVPTLGNLDTEFVGNLMLTLYPVHVSHMYAFIENMSVADARNKAVETALEEGCKYIYFRDNDVLVPPNALPILAARKVPVVGGLYYTKQKPPSPIVIVEGAASGDWKVGDFLKVDAVPMGCTLIDTDVFRKMSPPWFNTGSAFVDGMPNPTVEDHTEDTWFCKRLREELGIWPYVDTGILCIHKDLTTKERFFLDTNTNLPSWMTPAGKVETVLPADHPLATVVDLTKREGVTE